MTASWVSSAKDWFANSSGSTVARVSSLRGAGTLGNVKLVLDVTISSSAGGMLEVADVDTTGSAGSLTTATS